jgi:hypothetical protein
MVRSIVALPIEGTNKTEYYECVEMNCNKKFMVGVIDEFVKKWYEEWVWGICMSETSRCSIDLSSTEKLSIIYVTLLHWILFFIIY